MPALVFMLFAALLARQASVTDLPGWSTIPGAADKTGLSPWLIRKEIREGRLRARRVGRLLRVLDEDLSAWMRGDHGAPAA
jgi:excisionase family DNA binding protein